MGVIYKILKQQRQQQLQQQQQQQQQEQQQCNNMDLSTTTKCKVQAAIKQRQLQRLEVRQQQQMDTTDDVIGEQQLQQLYHFLAENASRKKRQRQRLRLQQMTGDDAEQPLCELQAAAPQPSATPTATATTTHEMDLLMEQLNSCGSDDITAISSTNSSAAPRDTILLKIRHQIFERKRQQRQRQLAELVQQRLVVWRPW